MSERTIKSHDGTQIVYEQHGQGPPLALVHAGFVDRTIWGPSLPLLAQHFTVYALDRRGHGSSEPYPADHAIEQEYEDLIALIAAVGAPVALLGHSSGARVALHAARHTPQVRRLVLYEPPQFESFTPAVRAQLHASLSAGDLDTIVSTVLIDVVEATLNPSLPPEARQQMLAGMRQSPIWSAALRNARSIPAEADSYATYHFDPT
jgi:pimeloyl-ACP methyl ester carboxylesterase